MTWRQLIENAVAQLELAEVDDPQANAEWMAIGVLGKWSRSELRAELKNEATPVESAHFTAYVKRRLMREPLQYILGEWEFYGLRLSVDRSALIPRPETELLVEESIRESEQMSGVIRVLDVGTGSGAIAIALAKNVKRMIVTAIDLSADALSLARSNAERLGLDIQFEQQDVFSDEWLESLRHSIDLVVSNPPYISIKEWENLPDELREHEPRMALTDNANGFRFYDRILKMAPELMSERGRVILELGYSADEEVRKIAEQYGLQTVRIVPDYAGIPRVFVASASGNV